jgi:hypothetical protein
VVVVMEEEGSYLLRDDGWSAGGEAEVVRPRVSSDEIDGRIAGGEEGERTAGSSTRYEIEQKR